MQKATKMIVTMLHDPPPPQKKKTKTKTKTKEKAKKVSCPLLGIVNN